MAMNTRGPGPTPGQNRTFSIALQSSAGMSDFQFRTRQELTRPAFEQATVWMDWEEPEQDIKIASWGVDVARNGSSDQAPLRRTTFTH